MAIFRLLFVSLQPNAINMMKKTLYFAIITVLMTACGSKNNAEANNADDAISMHENLPGDSALYGLACDG